MNSVRELAAELATELQSDIEKCVTREEHVRVSARANIAVQLLMRIDEILGHETEA
jgi:type IV secretory pathway ATPase VirB11/archaellum biosynthesis ATPase